jgi:di/tricarboxylate transporter
LKLHFGFLGIAFALFYGLGPYHLSVAEVLSYFPLKLFMTLMGVTSFFTAIEVNGTISRWVTLLQSFTSEKWLPFILSLFVSSITFIGVGNISSIGIVAPMAMSLAQNIKLNPLLMIIAIVSSANAASMSPMSLGGIVTKNLLDPYGFTPLAGWRVAFTVLVVQFFLASVGWLWLGGRKWLKEPGRRHDFTQSVQDWDRQHYMSTVLFILFVLAIAIESFHPGLEDHSRLLATLGAEPGFLGFFAVVGLMLTNAISNIDDWFQRIPWNTIFLISGLTFALQLFQAHDAFSFIVDLLTYAKSPFVLIFVLCLSAGLLSTVSSSVGVVLPFYLPIVYKLSLVFPQIPFWYLVAAVCTCAHLVDASPLSTLGALCVAQISDKELRNRTTKKLFVWGMVLAPIGAMIFALGSFYFFKLTK